MLRVHDLKQWAYCPRIVFFSYVMPVDRKTTFKMEMGKDAEEAVVRLEQRRRLSEYGVHEGRRRFGVWLTSEEQGLSGKLDLLIETAEERYPVDFKFSERDVHPNHVVQLAAYALLIEDRWRRPVERGFVFLVPREDIVEVRLTNADKGMVRDFLTAIRDSLRLQRMPEATSARARCVECEYRNYCADVF
jgi:CRISPR-associated exonuclease Cas4